MASDPTDPEALQRRQAQAVDLNRRLSAGWARHAPPGGRRPESPEPPICPEDPAAVDSEGIRRGYAVPVAIAEANIGFHLMHDRGGQFDHRGLVLRAVCDLEAECALLLFAFFKTRQASLEWDAAEADLFGETGMLGSLSRMVKLCAYLALLTNEEANDLKLFARLRNMYAHGRDRGQFYTDPKSAGMVRALLAFKNSPAVFAAHDEQGIFMACAEYLRQRLRERRASLDPPALGL